MPSAADRRAPGEHAVDWPELLVPFDGSHGAEQVLRRACRTARRDGVDLAVLCVVMMPPGDEEAWREPNLDSTAMVALARAQAVCREEGVVAVFQLEYARDLAEAIIAEARRSGATLICLSLREHELGETALMSETVQNVLAAAPCAVLLEDPSLDVLSVACDRPS